MVATGQLSERIDHWLRVAHREVSALPSVERLWREAEGLDVQSDDEILADRIGFRMEWADLMDRVEHRLQVAYLAEDMSPEQASQHRALLALLREMIPIMKRLELTPPSSVVLESPMSPTARPSVRRES